MNKFKDFAAGVIGSMVLALILGVIGLGLVAAGASVWHPLIVVGAIFILIAYFIGTNPV